MTKPYLLILFVLLVSEANLAEGNPRDLLAGRASLQELGSVLLSSAAWHPYPTIGERTEWQKVPESVRADCIRQAEQLLDTRWEPLPATLFLQYAREGNRTNYERASFARREKLTTLVFAELFENRGRFLDQIANGIWAICEESYWGVPAHVGLQKRGSGLPDVFEPTVDLFSAETGSLLAWTSYLLADRLDSVSPLIRDRIRLEADRRILTPNLDRDDFWWMGFGVRKDVNNWNPWICSNWLTVALLLEPADSRRTAHVHKILRTIDNFLNIYPEDGGCDEGPGYWGRAGASLFDCLELLDTATAGKIDIFGVPLIRKIGQFICKVYIKDEYYIDFADSSARLNPEGSLVYSYGKRIEDPVMAGFGAFLTRRQNPEQTFESFRNDSIGRMLRDVFLADEIAQTRPEEPFFSDFWLPDLQVMGARSKAGSAAGLYLAAKGGHNAESHNHNDVGNFLVYADGRPVLVDAGVGTYTSKTFSSRRYEIWTMQSDYHNLPTVNGVMQKDGREFRARDVTFSADTEKVTFALDLAGAYPQEAKVDSWRRSLTLNRGRNVELVESYHLRQFLKPFRLNLLTPLVVDCSQSGRVVLSDSGSGKRYSMNYDPVLFTASAEEIPLDDARLRASWGERLARIVLTSRAVAEKGSYTIRLQSIE